MALPLFQQILAEANFQAAWQKVRGNLGAPGVDRVSIEDFERNLYDNLALLRTLVAEGSYQPLPYLSFTHQKESGGARTLHIPTVRDRVVEQTVLLVVQPLFEKIFHNCSYAYRPGKSQLKALERVERNLKRGRVWVFDADIEKFFDEVDRTLLLKFVAETISEPPVLRLFELCINNSSSGREQLATANTVQLPPAPASATETKGIAQGMVLAPLLSNIYLHKLDDRMMRATWQYVRYSDNLLVLDAAEEQVKLARERAEQCLQELRLKFNEAKTAIVHLRQGFTFLGYRFDERGKRPAEAAVQRLEQRLGNLLQGATEYTEAELRQKLESIIRGWLNYFKLEAGDRQKLMQQLEEKSSPHSGADSLPQRILKAALAYQIGDRALAQQTLQSAPALSAADPDINLQWGVLCELVGMRSEALDSFLAAFRQNPDHPEAALRLGLYYLEQRQNQQAIRFLHKAVGLDAKNALSHFALATALQNDALSGAAQRFFQKAFQLDPRLKRVAPGALAKPQPKEQSVPFTFTDEDLAYFLKRFSGREGVFARQWLSPQGKLGYMPVYQPLTAAEVKAHLLGEQTLGMYLMRADNAVSHMILDLDLSKQTRSEVGSSSGSEQFAPNLPLLPTATAPAPWQRLLRNDAALIAQKLADLGLKAYLEDSGHKGLHLWLFFGEPIPARDVIAFSKKLLAALGPPPPGLTREVFPKQPRIASQALGAMVKLPLGIHKLTNRRCLFLDANGEPYPDQLAVLRNLETPSGNQFFGALDRLQAAATATATTSPLDTTAVDKIFTGCNVLRHFKEKAEKTKWLNHIERMTLLSVLGHFGPAGEQAIHQIIRHTTNYNHRITQKWIGRLKTFPVSCPKIREWHGSVTSVVGCCCEFPHAKNSYPSPVLHADAEMIVELKGRNSGRGKSSGSGSDGSGDRGQFAEAHDPQLPPATATASAPATATSSSPSALFASYLKLKKEQRETNHNLAQLEQQLSALCEQQKREDFVTEMGVLRRIKVGGEYRWVMEI